MNKTPVIPTEPGTIGVLHRTNSTWHALVANTRGGRPSIVNTQEFPADQAGRIDAWLNENHVAEVLCVLPAATVIARNCTLPDAPAEQLQQALALQAEAHLLGMAPSHRLGMAVLPNSHGETSRTGIILVWPEAAPFQGPPVSRPVQFVPDVAAMAALLNGLRPAEPLIWLDRSDGSIALALTHPGGAVFRGTREDAESPDAWPTSVARVMAETGLSVGHTGPFVENLAFGARRMASSLQSNESALFVPRDVMASVNQRVHGARNDSAWWSDYGIALGAILARNGPLASLTRFLSTPPLEKPSRIRSFATSMSQPRTAVRLMILAVLLLAIGPMLVHGLRWAVLRVRFGNLQDQVRAVNDYKHQVSMYNAMRDQKVWPMTKLLADIATNTPEGIDLETMRIEHGSEFAVQGTARDHGGKKATELVAQMQADLHSSGIFADVVYDWGEGNSMGVYKFNLSGKVAQPFKQKDYDPTHDFALWTLQARQAGESAPAKGAMAKADDTIKSTTAGGRLPEPDGGTLAVANGGEPEGQSNPTGNGRPSTNGGRRGNPSGASTPEAPGVDQGDPKPVDDPDGGDEGDSPGTGRNERRDRGRPSTGSQVPFGEPGSSGDTVTLPPSRDIPEAVSPEQIEKMTLSEAQAHLTKVSVARRHAQADAAVKARLKKEFELLLAHINKLKNP